MAQSVVELEAEQTAAEERTIRLIFNSGFLLALGRIESQLKSVRELIMSTNTGMQRLQDDSTKLQTQLTTLQAAFKSASDAHDAALTRLENDIQALKDAAGSGNTDAINAVATSMESTLAGFQDVSDKLSAQSTADGSVDPAPAPTPTPTPTPSTTLTVTPSSATVAPGGTQKFTANQAVNWVAESGTIDANGNYTAPTSGQTSDTVVATLQSDSTQSTKVAITVGATS